MAATLNPPAPSPPVRSSLPVRPRRGGRFRRVLLVLLAALSLVLAIFALQWFNRPAVEVHRVGRGTAVSAVYGTVNIAPSAAMTYFAQSTGNIKLDTGLGQGGVSAQGLKVKAGQLLAVIEDEPNRRALAGAATELKAAEAAANLISGTQRNLDANREQLNRLRRAGATISAAAVANQEALVGQLEAQLSNERSEVNRRLEQAQLNVDAIQKQLTRSEVRSTLDGVLTTLPPFDGTLVFVNTPLFTVATEATYVAGQVNEEDVGELKAGMKAEIRLYAYNDREFPATLDAVLPSGDPANQRYTVILHLDQPPANLAYNLTGEMNIIIGKHPNALLMPARALRDRDPKAGDRVFVVEDGVVAQRAVKVGYRNSEAVEVLEGLKEGDLVNVSDQDLRRAGERVRAVLVNASGKK